jgi:hypothetical protein
MIFSDNYTVKEKYSLLQKKHIGTFSEMPWNCTPLCDSRYLPKLSENVVNKLNNLFGYNYFFGQDTIRDEEKYLGLHHVEDEIISYRCRIDVGYYNIHDNFGWNHFVASSNILNLLKSKDTIEKLTSETDIHYTNIVAVEFNQNCEEEFLYILDTTYNLDEYTDNQVLNKLNDFCKKSKQLVEGWIGIHSDTNKIKFVLDLKYPFAISFGDYKDPDYYKKNDIEVPPFVASEQFLISLFKSELLTKEQVEHITQEILGDLEDQNYKFDMEYSFDEAGNLEDIIFHRCKYEEFDEIETPL